MEILLATRVLYAVALLVVGYVLYRAIRAGVRDGILRADERRERAARDAGRMPTGASQHSGSADG